MPCWISDLWHLIESSVWVKEVDILTLLFWRNYKGMGKSEESYIERRERERQRIYAFKLMQWGDRKKIKQVFDFLL